MVPVSPSVFPELNRKGRATLWEAQLAPSALHRSPPSGSHRAVRTLCDHSAAGPDQLSFRHGEVLRVLATVDEDWLRCGRDGAEGLVPVGYTSLVL